MDKDKVVFIVGPTSSGKTRVAVELARRLNGEVISCDSMQVYRDMDVITRPPGGDIVENIPCHLTRSISPEEEYNAARFQKEAKRTIADILFRDHVPLVAGGTGLYMKALIDGIFAAPPEDKELREELKKEAEEKGEVVLHERLKRIDPETADKLHPNDTRRIIRALEVYELTGRTISSKKEETEGGITSQYDYRIFGMELARDLLYERINKTVEKMFDEGLLEEVKKLRKRDLSKTAAKALGIKEISSYLEGATGLEGAAEELKKNTRQYAKRQLTWFRADKRIEWVDADRDTPEIVRDILGRLNE